MPKFRNLICSFLLILSFILPYQAFAITDPTAVPNNKFGIHILFPTELNDAAALVNSAGGDWGYVTIPIQAGDQDLDKWQTFMDQAKEKHLIPIIRLATEGDYFNTKVWRIPTTADVLDFANFLHSLSWPTKNKYIIVFNEVNRGDEWGGAVDPAVYANLLSYATTTFKTLDSNFFIISSGMDNAAPNALPDYMNEYAYMREMEEAKPGIFREIDGIASHAYPNPAFAQPPSVLTNKSIDSFSYEKSLADEFAQKSLPVFITETGWSNSAVSDAVIGTYYTKAFQSVWNDKDIVAVTPFLLHSGSGPFGQFSFLRTDGTQTSQYAALLQLTKVKGSPILENSILAAQINTQTMPNRDFRGEDEQTGSVQISEMVKDSLKWLLKL